MMAGDNPIYALSSDTVIPISVPHNKSSVKSDYVNIYPPPSSRHSGSIDGKEMNCTVHFVSVTDRSSPSVDEFNDSFESESSGPHPDSGIMHPTLTSAAVSSEGVNASHGVTHHTSGGRKSSQSARRNCYENVYS